MSEWQPTTDLVLSKFLHFVHGCADTLFLVDNDFHGVRHLVARCLPLDRHLGCSAYVGVGLLHSISHLAHSKNLSGFLLALWHLR